jgi:hypothetical protein
MIWADHHYRQESFVVLNFLNLSKTISDKASFIDVDISIHINFVLKDPFALNGQFPNLDFTAREVKNQNLDVPYRLSRRLVIVQQQYIIYVMQPFTISTLVENRAFVQHP